MKTNILILFVSLFLLYSCDNSENLSVSESNYVELNPVDERSIGSDLPSKRWVYKGELHKGSKTHCEDKFGFCKGHWEWEAFVADNDDDDVQHEYDILARIEGDLDYVYLLENVPHAETEFVVQEPTEVPFIENGIYILKTIEAGIYTFELEGEDYSDTDLESFGRIQLN